MDTQASSAQEPTSDPSEASERSKPIPVPEGESTPPTTISTSSSSRPRRQWSRLESAKNRLKASETLNAQFSSSQLQPQDNGPSSRVDSLSNDLDTLTLNETINDEAMEKGTADAFPSDKQAASETAAHDSPASEHNEDKSKPDARNPPPKSSKQDPGAATPPLFSVDKAAEDASKLLGLEHRQGFLTEEYDKIQDVSVNVGQLLRNIHWNMTLRQQQASTGHPVCALSKFRRRRYLERKTPHERTELR
ncbi:hypothetical protein CEP54_008789 [Fusarium duplospermum]|uniref:Uncharacterized protein n=1 Tax=Fusarium duplospermum TaxID=1325734 RepID=A0A428PTS5_9HYPO|nr:hypothetical protein CEP54_008789 [Fusarium duplospermum]